jgi:hypothetical protein
MVEYYAYISMYDYVMIFVVVPFLFILWCNLVSIHIGSLSCHLITLVLLGTPRFTKLYKRPLINLLV